MSGLIIHGSHGSDVWVEVAGDLYCLTRPDLTVLTNRVRVAGTVLHAGIRFDEADVIELVNASRGPQLDDCECGGPGLVHLEGRVVCPGCVRAYGDAEDWSA